MRKLVVVAAGVVAAGIAALAVPQIRGSMWPEIKAADAPAATAPGIPVTVGKVEAKDMPVLLSSIGTVQAYNTVLIKTRVDGQIVKVNFQEGQEIQAGDPLVEIDPRPYKAVYDQAVAKLETDQATLVNAQRNYDRDAQIVNSNLAVSRQQFDNDKTAVATAQGLSTATRRRWKRRRSISTIATSTRRSRAGSACAWWTSGTSCTPRTQRGW